MNWPELLIGAVIGASAQAFLEALWPGPSVILSCLRRWLAWKDRLYFTEDDMPAKSKAQQRAMAIAMHQPEKLYARNRAMKAMSHGELEKFAGTPRKGLPQKKGKR